MDLARGRQHSHVVAVSEDTAATIRDAVHGAGQPGTDRFHTASERLAVVGLDDEVCVIALERIVHQTKPRPPATAGE
jgi:hypothetical protein